MFSILHVSFSYNIRNISNYKTDYDFSRWHRGIGGVSPNPLISAEGFSQGGTNVSDIYGPCIEVKNIKKRIGKGDKKNKTKREEKNTREREKKRERQTKR